jgi:hypothetical protein
MGDFRLFDYRCPKCNRRNIVWEEQVWEYRYVKGMDSAGVVLISDSINHYDTGGENGRFACMDCLYNWPTEDVEVEF